jgi:2-isopropylmalate synthase
MRLAFALAETGVDVIETGFPLSGKIDFEFCRAAARELVDFSEGLLTAVMCRGRRQDIAESAKIFAGGIPGILHISLPVSRIHIEAKFGKGEKEIAVLAREAVTFAAGLAAKVEIGAEDAFRADRNFLVEYCAAALDAGAEIINIADTLGTASPVETRDLVEFLCARIPAFISSPEKAVLSIHCHNDLGLACANTLAALEAGCGQAELTVSGIGERAGNAALEEVAANIALGSKKVGLYTNLRPEKFPPLLNLAAEAAGCAFSLMKPLSGWNARSHSSGIHLQGLAKNTETYSFPALEPWITAPERIVLSRHSGRAGIALFARRYCGLSLDEKTLDSMSGEIKKSETVTGITEFLRLLFDLGKLPGGFPGPLICVSFTAAFSSIPNPRVSVEAALRVYGGTEPERPVSGAGKNEAEAVSAVLKSAGYSPPEFSRVSLNGYGGRLRLYAELAFPSGRAYALERAGSSPAEILFLCGRDALNAEAVREAV